MALRPEHPRASQPSAAQRRAQKESDQEPAPPKKQPVEEEEECVFCKRADNDPYIFGETCQRGGLRFHKNCLYHASNLTQRGEDNEGFFGFLLPDIQQELQRVAQKKCCICQKWGASVRCHHQRCSCTFHFPCGRERGCVSQFFGEYRSFCWQHAPKQQVRLVPQEHRQCTVCMEAVEEHLSFTTLTCPACNTAHFHRYCVQRQALIAARHRFHCLFCWDMETFQAEMLKLGINIPSMDPDSEEEEDSQELSEQHSSCSAVVCLCPQGREHSATTGFGPWRLLTCSTCRSRGTHQFCTTIGNDDDEWECDDCFDADSTTEHSTTGTGSPQTHGRPSSGGILPAGATMGTGKRT